VVQRLTGMVTLAPAVRDRSPVGPVYAWSGFAIMWAFWVSFVMFLAAPRLVLSLWPLPTIDHGSSLRHPLVAAVIDLSLIALFGAQHSVMARPWFKRRLSAVPAAFERCTYVHSANFALFLFILCWQPIPSPVWHIRDETAADALWALFAAGWTILFLGAWSFGIRDLLGISQMQAWVEARPPLRPSLKTGHLYRWLRHPMYIGVLLGVWATPRMSVGHLLLASGLTMYVFIAMRYEERDLARAFGASYQRWRATDVSTHRSGNPKSARGVQERGPIARPKWLNAQTSRT
jgi:methanethiol S-methyltransferase